MLIVGPREPLKSASNTFDPTSKEVLINWRNININKQESSNILVTFPKNNGRNRNRGKTKGNHSKVANTALGVVRRRDTKSIRNYLIVLNTILLVCNQETTLMVPSLSPDETFFEFACELLEACPLWARSSTQRRSIMWHTRGRRKFGGLQTQDKIYPEQFWHFL